MKMKKTEPTGTTKIHNVRFYNLSPRSITCLAYNQRSSKLAMARADASIDIWDMSCAPFLEKTIPGVKNYSVEGLGWSGDRLFSAGLAGELVEWDLHSLEKRRVQYATGSAIWCLDVNREQNQIAIGTEEGYLNLFDIADDEMNYQHMFDKQEGRILCCKFDATGDFVVTGSIDVIRIWNAKSGHAIHKMTLSRSEAKKETIVWSLQVLRDFTIISGDSRGQVTVWDGRVGAQIEAHQVLKADVLTVAVNEEENMLICSGIDPIIRIYALTSIKKEDGVVKKWIKFLQRSVHDHDVKAIVCAGDKILSGGLDGYLGVSSYSKVSHKTNKHGPFLQGSCASISTEKRLILLRYATYLEIWKLGSTKGQEQYTEGKLNQLQANSKLLTLEDNPEKLVELRSKNDSFIVSSSLSPDGCWLAYSTQDEIRMFSFVPPTSLGDKSQILRVKVLPDQFSPATLIRFSSDSKHLFLIKASNQIDVFTILSNGDIDHTQTIDASKYIKDRIHLADVSHCGKYFIAAGLCRTISVWAKAKKDFKHHLNLPRYIVATTALAIHRDSPRLVAAFADSKIFEYDLEEMCFTCSDKQRFVGNSETHCISKIVLDARNPNVFVMHNDANLFVLEKTTDDVDEESSKRTKTEGDEKVPKLKLKFQKSYVHFVHLDWLTDDELVAVGVNPVSLLEELPAAMKQKKFGAA